MKTRKTLHVLSVFLLLAVCLMGICSAAVSVDDVTSTVGPKVTLKAITDIANPTYQWYTCDDASGTNAQPIADATGASYTTDYLDVAGTTYYKVVVSDTESAVAAVIATMPTDYHVFKISSVDDVKAYVGASGVPGTAELINIGDVYAMKYNATKGDAATNFPISHIKDIYLQGYPYLVFSLNYDSLTVTPVNFQIRSYTDRSINGNFHFQPTKTGFVKYVINTNTATYVGYDKNGKQVVSGATYMASSNKGMWKAKLTNLRLDFDVPTSPVSAVGQPIHFEYMGFFPTEAAAKAYAGEMPLDAEAKKILAPFDNAEKLLDGAEYATEDDIAAYVAEIATAADAAVASVKAGGISNVTYSIENVTYTEGESNNYYTFTVDVLVGDTSFKRSRITREYTILLGDVNVPNKTVTVGPDATITADIEKIDSFTYQWYTCNADGSGAVAIEGATKPYYTRHVDEAGTTYYKLVVNGVKESNVATFTAEMPTEPIVLKFNNEYDTKYWSTNLGYTKYLGVPVYQRAHAGNTNDDTTTITNIASYNVYLAAYPVIVVKSAYPEHPANNVDIYVGTDRDGNAPALNTGATTMYTHVGAEFVKLVFDSVAGNYKVYKADGTVSNQGNVKFGSLSGSRQGKLDYLRLDLSNGASNYKDVYYFEYIGFFPNVEMANAYTGAMPADEYSKVVISAFEDAEADDAFVMEYDQAMTEAKAEAFAKAKYDEISAAAVAAVKAKGINTVDVTYTAGKYTPYTVGEKFAQNGSYTFTVSVLAGDTPLQRSYLETEVTVLLMGNQPNIFLESITVPAGPQVTLAPEIIPGLEATSFQWYTCDANGENAVAIEGATSETYTFWPFAGTTYYMVVVNGTEKSNVMTFTATAPTSPVVFRFNNSADLANWRLNGGSDKALTTYDGKKVFTYVPGNDGSTFFDNLSNYNDFYLNGYPYFVVSASYPDYAANQAIDIYIGADGYDADYRKNHYDFNFSVAGSKPAVNHGYAKTIINAVTRDYKSYNAAGTLICEGKGSYGFRGADTLIGKLATLRVDFSNNNAGKPCYIEYFGFFPTEEMALAYKGAMPNDADLNTIVSNVKNNIKVPFAASETEATAPAGVIKYTQKAVDAAAAALDKGYDSAEATVSNGVYSRPTKFGAGTYTADIDVVLGNKPFGRSQTSFNTTVTLNEKPDAVVLAFDTKSKATSAGGTFVEKGTISGDGTTSEDRSFMRIQRAAIASGNIEVNYGGFYDHTGKKFNFQDYPYMKLSYRRNIASNAGEAIMIYAANNTPSFFIYPKGTNTNPYWEQLVVDMRNPNVNNNITYYQEAAGTTSYGKMTTNGNPSRTWDDIPADFGGDTNPIEIRLTRYGTAARTIDYEYIAFFASEEEARLYPNAERHYDTEALKAANAFEAAEGVETEEQAQAAANAYLASFGFASEYTVENAVYTAPTPKATGSYVFDVWFGADKKAEYTVKVTMTIPALPFTPVAKIGDEEFATLQAAFDAAQDGDIIYVIENITIELDKASYNDGTYVDGIRYTGDKSFTVDFGGFTVTDDGCVNDYLIYMNNKGEKANEITFTNGTLDVKNGSWATVCVGSTAALNNTVLNLNGMTITNKDGVTYYGNQPVRARGSDVATTTVNVNNGTTLISDNASYALSPVNSKSVVNVNSGAKLIQKNTANAGGNHTAAALGGLGVANVYDGAIIESDNYGIYPMTSGNAVVNVYGGTITAPYAVGAFTNGGEGETVTINVTGGTFAGEFATSKDGTITITDGIFNTDVTEYLAPDLKLKDNGNGTFGVVEKVYIAAIGEEKFESIQSAVNAASENDVITVIANASDEAVTVDKSLTITGDATLNNVSITASGTTVELTVTNLTFTGSSYINANNAAALTVTGVNADVNPTKITGRAAFIVLGTSELTHGLKVTIKDNTILSAQSTTDGYSAAIFGWRYIADGSEISGNTFGADSDTERYTFIVVKTMNAMNDATITLANNTLYGTNNIYVILGFDLYQNNSRANAYTIISKDNVMDFAINAESIYPAIAFNISGNTAFADATNLTLMDNGTTVNGEALTLKDIDAADAGADYDKFYGVDVVTDESGAIVDGTFSANPALSGATIAPDLKAVENEDGSFDITERVYTANVESYEEMVEALADEDVNTINVTASFEAENVMIIGKSVTINGDNNTITSSANRIFRVAASDISVEINSLKLESEAIRVETADIRGISIDVGVANSELTLNNCSVIFTDASATDWSYAVNICGNTTDIALTINGGIYNGSNVINVWGSNHTIIIDAATLTSIYGYNALYIGSGIHFDGTANSATITNTTFNGSHAKPVYESTENSNTIVEENNIDNTFITGATVTDSEGNTTAYATLTAAVEAAQNGDTVNMLKDVALTERLDIADKALTINLGGRNITSTVDDSFGAIYVKKGATLTIEGEGNITSAGITIGTYGTVNIEGGNIVTTGEDYTALYVFYYTSDFVGTATVNGGSVNSIWNCGTLTVSGGTVDYLDTSSELIVTGGTITEILAKDGSDADGEYTITISDPSAITVPDGFVLKEIEDGKYQVVEDAALVQNLDADGNVLGKYSDFESAIAAAVADTNTARVEILGDITQETIAALDETHILTENHNLTIGVPEGEEYTVTLSRVNGATFSIYLMENGASLTIEEGVTLIGLDIVANGFATSNNKLVINGTLYAMSLKQWTSNNDIIIGETGRVVLGYGDGQLDLAYGNGSVTINGNGDMTEPQFKAGYSGTRGNGNTFTLNNTSFDAGAWFNVNGSNGTFNIDNSVFAVSGGDGTGKLDVTSTGNTFNVTNGGTLNAGVINLGAGNDIVLGAGSSINATTISGAGTISIDATGLTAGNVPTITGDASGFTGTLEITNNDNLDVIINEEGNIVLVKKAANVAKIGDIEYPSLQAAFEAVQDGETIVLLDNITIEGTTDGVMVVDSNKSVTLDLNGKTITAIDNATGNFSLFFIGGQTDGELTVKDSGENGTITLTATNNRAWNALSGIFHNRGGVLNIESGTYIHNGGTDMAWVIDNSANSYGDATTTVNGGTLYSTYTAIRNRMEAYGANGNGNGEAVIIVNGGNIDGETSAIWGQAASSTEDKPAKGEISVTDGEIGTINVSRDATSKAMLSIYGGTVANIKAKAGEVRISGGTLTGALTILDANGNAVESDSIITGGTFYSDLSAYVSDGYILEENENGTYGVVADTGLSGSGTKEDPYTINNIDELMKFRNYVNAGNTYEGEYVLLTADIDLTGKVWTPIGTSIYDKTPYSDDVKMFAGNFDGGDHTITGLTSDGYVPASSETESTEYSFGLFGYVYGANISNVKLADININGTTREDSEGNSVAGSGVAALVGYYYVADGKECVIENCHVLSGTVTASNNMGGLIGFIDSQVSTPQNVDITIKNCSNAADVTSEAREAGGIVGLLNASREDYSPTMAGNITFENCVNTGDVTTYGGGGSTFAGGILGKDQNEYSNQQLKITFDGCENSGTITVYANGETHVGGIGSSLYSTGAWLVVKNSTNTGNVVVVNPENANPLYEGGLLGYAGVMDVINSISTGTVTVGTEAGNKYIGDVQYIAFVDGIDDFNAIDTGDVYYLNGGTSPEFDALVDDPSNSGGNFNVIVKTAYKDNAEFGGWYDNSECTGSPVTVFTKGADIYYAKWIDFVAEIGDTKYATLEEAIAAATTGETVTLLTDITLEKAISIPSGSEVVLDLNGKTITYTSDIVGEAMISNNGTLTINDETGNGSIVYTYTGEPDTTFGKGNYTIINHGTLVINGGEIRNDTAAMTHAYYTIHTSKNLTVNGGNIIGATCRAIRVFVAGNASYELDINGGYIKGTMALYLQAAGSNAADAPNVNISISGGEFVGTSGFAYYTYSNGNSLEKVDIDVYDGNFDGYFALAGGNTDTVENVTVTGGTFMGDESNDLFTYSTDYETAQAAITITGGTFSSNSAEYYAADDGYEFKQNEDGTYGVIPVMHVLGDVDGDGSLSVSDAILTLRAIATSLEIFTEDQMANADVNGDGEVTVSDVIRMLQYIAAH